MSPQIAKVRRENTPVAPRPVGAIGSPLGRQQRFHTQAQQLVDAVVLVLALVGAYLVRELLAVLYLLPPGQPFSSYLFLCVVVATVGPYSLSRFGFYQQNLPSRRIALWMTVKGVGVLVLLITGATYLTKDQDPLSRIILSTFTFGACGLIWIRHLIWRRMNRTSTGVERHNVALFGTRQQTQGLRDLITEHPEWGVRISGMLEEQTSPETLVALLHERHVESVIISAARTTFDRIEEVIRICEIEGVDVWVMADFVNTLIARMSLDQFHGQPMLRFQSKPDHSWALLVKRTIDFVGSALGILILGPLVMLPTALAIRLTSRGPVLFRQLRCGLHGRTFMMYKFRSMVADAESLRGRLDAMNEQAGPVFKLARDPRVTPVGRFIRKMSIDELPQLFNVFRGDMSIVGPRPPIPSEVAKYERWQRRRLSMKPGLTCLWQVSGRNKIGFEEWMKLDLAYIDSWSLALDLKIIVRTVPVVLLGSGAH